jgi:predicted phage tail protein
MLEVAWQYPTAQGRGGGKDSGHEPVEKPDTLFSNSTAAIIDLLSEGEIGGLVDGDRSIYFNEVSLRDQTTTDYNFKGAVVFVNNGIEDQPAIPGFENVSTSVAVAQDLPYNVYKTISFPNDGTYTAVDVTIAADSFFMVEKDGDTVGTSVTFVIELSENGGTFIEVVKGTIRGKQSNEYNVDFRVHVLDTNGNTSVRVKRLSPDATSLRVNNEIKFKTYTKVVEHKLTYPNCAVSGTIISAKQFGNQIPQRAYKINGIKVSVPHNYDPVTRVYSGTFNGSLSGTKQFTNNPAWVFYDLITHTRYGLGQFFDSSLIDIPSLYTISKWCDAVDARPYYFKASMYTHAATGTATWQTNSGNYTSGDTTVKGTDGTYAIYQTVDATAAGNTLRQINHADLAMTNNNYAVLTTGIMGYGTTTTAEIGIYDVTGSSWGSDADSTARIMSGPGTLTQESGGRWSLAGLSTTELTHVEITRRATGSVDFRAHWYLDASTTTTGSHGGALWWPQFERGDVLQIRISQAGATAEGGTTDDYDSVTGRHGVPDGRGGFEPRWVCNTVINSRGDAFNVLREMVSCFRGILFWMDGKLWAQADLPRDPVKIVTNANVIDGVFTYSGESNRSRVSVINVSWNDPDIFYRRAIEVYEDPDLIREIGWKTADHGAFGCTSRSQARRLAKAILYSQENESELVTYKASFDHLAVDGDDGPVGISPGDVILIADRERGNAISGGRVLSATAPDFTIADTVELGLGTVYIEHAATGTVEWVACSFDTNTVTLLETPTEAVATNDAYILVEGGDEAETFRVIKITQSDQHIFEIAAVRYDEAKFDEIYGTISTDETDIMRIPRAVTMPAVDNLAAVESFVFGADYSSRTIEVSWNAVVNEWLDGYIVTFIKDNENPVSLPMVGGSAARIENARAGEYIIRVQARNRFGFLGPASTFTLTLGAVPAGLAVGDPANLALHGGGTTFSGVDAKFKWTLSSPTATYLDEQSITVDTGVVDPYFRDFLVTMKKVDDTVLRTASVVGTEYIYTKEMMFEDTTGTIADTFKIEVQYRDIYGRLSAAQSLTVTNADPGAPTSLSVTANSLSNIIQWTNPTDTDLVYIEVLASTTDSFATATAVGHTLTGQFLHENLTAGVTWYYWVRSVDTWGNIGTETSAGSAAPLPSASTGANEIKDDWFGATWTLTAGATKIIPTATSGYAAGREPFALELSPDTAVVRSATGTLIPVVVGRRYYFSARVSRGTTLGAGSQLKLGGNWIGSDGTTVISAATEATTQTSATLTAGALPTELTWSQIAPASAAFFQPKYYTPALASSSGTFRVEAPRVSLSEPGASSTLSVGFGPTAIGVIYDYTNTTAQDLPKTVSYALYQNGVLLTTGVVFSYRVVSGGINGFDNADGYQTLTVTSGVADLVISSAESTTSVIEIKGATSDGSSVIAATVAKTLAAAPTGGSGSSTATQSSGFSQINSTSYAAITNDLVVTLPTGKTATSTQVSLTLGPVSPTSGTWSDNVTLKLQEDVSGVWTDRGTPASADSNPDPGRSFDVEVGSVQPNEGELTTTISHSGLTAGTTKTYRIVAKCGSSGHTVSFTGEVAVSCP